MGSEVSTVEVKGEDCCEVTTWTRPIQGGSSLCSETTLFNLGFDHSVVAFEYADGVFVCEAGEDNGWLRGIWEFIEVEEFEKQLPTKKRNFGCHKLTKEFLLDTLKRIATCGRYDIIANNCHSWVKVLLYRTGVYVNLLDM